MRKSQKILFLICIGVYILTKLSIFIEVPIGGFAKNHLADLMCMPIILSIIQLIIQQFDLHFQQHNVPIVALLVLTIYWSFYFEYYLPNQDAKHTGDTIDVAMYFIGTALFIIFQKQHFYFKKSF